MQVERVRSICYQPGVLAVFLVPKRVLPVYQVPTHVGEPSDIQDFKWQREFVSKHVILSVDILLLPNYFQI